MGAKRPLDGTSKSEQTDTQTDVRTDGRTNRLIESIGPEGRCFEKKTRAWQGLSDNWCTQWVKLWGHAYKVMF